MNERGRKEEMDDDFYPFLNNERKYDNRDIFNYTCVAGNSLEMIRITCN